MSHLAVFPAVLLHLFKGFRFGHQM